MGLYSDRILPWLMEQVLSRPIFHEQRLRALAPASGRVLEIGFGFGASLPAYPAGAVREIVALDPGPGMIRRARRHAARSPVPVRLMRATAAALPLREHLFDTVVSQWTLCTIPDLPAALAEIRRVLRHGGRFLFLEHGLADDPALARWQRRLTPLQRRLAGGCRLDVPIESVIAGARFHLESLERYEMELGPRPLRQMYRGVARVG
jgi:ubiquinone/menaquinone biosynthesis C-methylase UbiE